MSINTHSTDFYNDFSSLDRLRARARRDPGKTLEKVAQQFESIFVKMMLDSMRDATFGDPLMGSEDGQFFQNMYDEQLSVEMSKTGSIGLADVIVKQLKPTLPDAANSQSTTTPRPVLNNAISAMRMHGSNVNHAIASYQKTQTMSVEEAKPLEETKPVVKAEPVTKAEPAAKAEPVVNAEPIVKAEPIKTPEQFIKLVWNDAKSAAAELGVQPEVLVAQAALETGWGKYIIQNRDGSSSHNLFNIKADRRWDGETAQKQTSEFVSERKVKQHASFRSYDNYKQSFSDYVRFIKQSARYQNALGYAHDGEKFVTELQKAGYATDPRYAEKISNIMQRESVKNVIASLKTLDAQASARADS